MVVVLPIGIYVDFLLVSYYSVVDVLVVHIWILYYNHNTRQFVESAKRSICLNQSVTHFFVNLGIMGDHGSN